MSLNRKITNQDVRNWESYRKFYEITKAKGNPQHYKLNKTADIYYESLTRFAERYDEVAFEKTIGKGNFKGTILNEVMERSYRGGTGKQLSTYYNQLKKQMDQLKEADPDLYKQIESEFHFSKLEGQDLLKLEKRGGNLMNSNRWFSNQRNPEYGYFDKLYQKLDAYITMPIIWNSPD